jgi:hypothetical protein
MLSIKLSSRYMKKMIRLLVPEERLLYLWASHLTFRAIFLLIILSSNKMILKSKSAEILFVFLSTYWKDLCHEKYFFLMIGSILLFFYVIFTFRMRDTCWMVPIICSMNDIELIVWQPIFLLLHFLFIVDIWVFPFLNLHPSFWNHCCCYSPNLYQFNNFCSLKKYLLSS